MEILILASNARAKTENTNALRTSALRSNAKTHSRRRWESAVRSAQFLEPVIRAQFKRQDAGEIGPMAHLDPQVLQVNLVRPPTLSRPITTNEC